MLIDKIKNCTSCGMCVVSCPKQCLRLQLNDDGFYRPVFKEGVQCINCGVCERHCPSYLDTVEKDALTSVALKAKDNITLASTSSGGICYALAKNAIMNSSKVCACEYDYNEHFAKHVVIDSVEDLEGTKGSKYFQSYTPDAFEKIFDGGSYTVFGTPCQIAAVDSYATKKGVRDKLLLVDFFCHGTPSINLWQKYLYENDKERIRRIEFRSKEFGWGSFSFKFYYEDGTTKSDFKNNMFYNFFFNNLALNDSCYKCNFKALKSNADIRVGDYWGEEYKNDKTGVSCCVTFTEKGRVELDKVLDCFYHEEVEVDSILQEQMTQSPPLKKERKRVLKALKGKKKLKTINNTTLFFYRAKCKLNGFFKGE